MPGVSSFTAVAARIGRELTIPEVAQSVILTRLGGGKTPMPPGEQVAEFARHQTTMALFLSAARSGQLQDELLAGGYPPDTPCVVAYQVTWPDELIVPTALAKTWPPPSRNASSGSTRWCWSGPAWPPAAAAPTCTTQAISTVSARRTGRPGSSFAKPPNHGRQTRDPARRPRTARTRPAPDGEGQEAGAAHRLDHRDLRGGGREGGHYRAGHRRTPGNRGDRPAVRPAGPVRSGRMHPDARQHSRGGGSQGRGRRPRRHARRAADRDRALARRARNRAGRRRRRGGGHQAGPRPGAGRPGHQPGPPRDDHPVGRRSHRPSPTRNPE